MSRNLSSNLNLSNLTSIPTNSIIRNAASSPRIQSNPTSPISLQSSTISIRLFSSSHFSLSGSNKWSKIKHKKAAQDALKGNTYGALSREILSSIKASPLPKDLASLPEHNSRLAYLLKKARDLDIPKDKIETTLQKARNQGTSGEEIVIYEVLGNTSHSKPFFSNKDGDGNGGDGGDGNGSPIALVIECNTDSTARTIAKLKESLNKMHSGWRLGNTGHLFDKVGRIWLNLEKKDGKGEIEFDKVFELAVENGAEEVRWLEEEEWIHEESLGNVKEKGEAILEILCPPSSLRQISTFLTTKPHQYSILLSEQRLVPSGPTIRILDSDSDSASNSDSKEEDLEIGGYVDETFVEKLDKLAELLEESADAQRIFSNLQGWQWPR